MHRKKMGRGKRAVATLALALTLSGLTAAPAMAAVDFVCFDKDDAEEFLEDLKADLEEGVITPAEYVAELILIAAHCGAF